MYVCCGVGCVRLSRCVWMRMVLDVDGEARCCRLVERMCIWMRTARRVAVAWLRIFFIFCLRRGGGYMYS